MLQLVVWSILCVSAFTATERPPNIIFFMPDDLGASDVSFFKPFHYSKQFGESPVKTPNIDDLANEGLIFTKHYTDSICGPSRSALLTSRSAWSMGYPFAMPGEWGSLNDSYATFPQKLKEKGYKTSIFGKWGIDFAGMNCTKRNDKTKPFGWYENTNVSGRKFGPRERGFDRFIGGLLSGQDFWTRESDLCPGDWHLYNETHTLHFPHAPDRKLYSTHETTLDTIEFINDYKDVPFFTWVTYYAPHNPQQAPEFYANSETCKNIPSYKRRYYCGQVMTVDESIKNITAELRRLNLLEDTIIVFSSDNGGMPQMGGFNYPYKGTKGQGYEGGMRTPAFIYSPKYIPKGVYNDYFTLFDWGPTLLSLIDGRNDFNLLPTFSNNTNEKIDEYSSEGLDLSRSLLGMEDGIKRKGGIFTAQIIYPQFAAYSGDMKIVVNPAMLDDIYREPNGIWSIDSNQMTFQKYIVEIINHLFFAHSGEGLAKEYGLFIIMWFWDWNLPSIRDHPWNVQGKELIHGNKHYWTKDFKFEWEGIRYFNITADPYESNNLRDERVDEVKKLMSATLARLYKSPHQNTAIYAFFESRIKKLKQLFKIFQIIGASIVFLLFLWIIRPGWLFNTLCSKQKKD